MRSTETTLYPDTVSDLRACIAERGLRATARDAGVSANTVKRALAGKPIAERSAAALRRVPPRVRSAADFVAQPRVQPPRSRDTALSWSIESIRAALESQMRGVFALPRRLAEAMRRDDAIFTARSNRLAPFGAVATELVAHDSDRGRNLAAKARDSVQVPRTVLKAIGATLVDHAVAIGYVEHEANADGTRIDMRLTEWPLEHVRWNDSAETLETPTRDGSIVPITHGDGRWIVFRRSAGQSWRDEACILPAGFVWAGHAEGVANWQSSSRAHGLAKIIGELPEGGDINTTTGELTVVAQRFLDMMRDLAEGDESVGLRPAGSKADFVANGSTAWQIFDANVVSREKAAARIYLGTDAHLGSVGGAPGVDIAELFGVSSTKTQDDFTAIQDGLATGLYEPWAAINTGDTRYAPGWRFALPDPDAERKRAERATNRTRLTNAIAEMRAQKLDVTQTIVNTLAREYDVTPTPTLAALNQATTTIALAPTDIAKVVRVSEARSSQGLPPFGDERDEMTIAQLDAWIAAQSAAPAPAA